jgi:hypothetical protein
MLMKTIPVGFSHPVNGRQILEYLDYCKTGKYDKEKHNHPSYAMLADFMQDDAFLEEFGKYALPQLWKDEELMMYDHIFWAYVYLPYINETFYLGIPEDDKEIVSYMLKYKYEKIDRSDPSWILSMDFDDDIEEQEGDLFSLRATRVRKSAGRKKKFSHKACLYRFLTFNPPVAKKILGEDPYVFICDTNLAARLRKRVIEKDYDTLVQISEKELLEKAQGISCWSEEDERRFREFRGDGDVDKLISASNTYDSLTANYMERRTRLDMCFELLGLSTPGDRIPLSKNPHAGMLSRIDQAEEARVNKQVENYRKQQSIEQKRKNKQRKKEEANQCYQGPRGYKPGPKRPVC